MDLAAARAGMVARQIAARGVRDVRVLEAMRTVPRERFVPSDQAGFAYSDTPLAIEKGQTISQPYIVALMALQKLVRIRRVSDLEYEQEELQPVRFVPLIGAAGWQPTTA